LFLVATPIGNLGDISARALQTLRDVSLIAAEDTRRTAKLLSHFNIHTPQTSYFDHNKGTKLGKVLAAMQKGDVALVCDAGSPALNDPGYLLVRAAVEAGHTVSPIPGPSAPVAALTASGLPSDQFVYLGYLPRKSGQRRTVIRDVAHMPYTLIWLESPHRLSAALEDLGAELGARQIAVAGELTKMYEEIFRGTIEQAIAHFKQHPARGEYTLVVEGHSGEKPAWNEAEVRARLDELLAKGESPSQAARTVAKESGWPRREIYALSTQIPADEEDDQ
ncbi:MAG: 16S rRNA (cytidine(1402)-2'-O)-methyltransferase, partial [Anaerolineae bacterium]|nr:16S rRNA (cytidine(1402)-2'-O)-methyltransferase [Anaerolineae bacterium]